MSARTRSHLIFLCIDAVILWILWDDAVELSKVWRLTAKSQEPVDYDTWSSMSVMMAGVLFLHIMSIFELFDIPERSKKLWKVVVRSAFALVALAFASCFAIHYSLLAHLDRVGYVNCPALEKRGRIVILRTYMRPPLPERCEKEP